MANCKDCFHRTVCDGDLGYGWAECPQFVNTADVVPREEVDRLRHTLDSYALQYGTVKDQHAVIDRIKAETAREIFAEIKNLCSLHHEFNGTQIVAHIDFKKLAELKKKYTEGGK